LLTSKDSHTQRRRASRIGVISIVGLAVVLAACGNSSKSTTGSSGASLTGISAAATRTACMAAASKYLESWDILPTTLPGAFTPLPVKPMPGGSIIRMVGPLPSEITSADAMIAAAKTIGWTGKIVQFNGSVEDLNSKLEEAISDRPTAIIESGFPTAAIEKPLADAKAAGIVVVVDNDADVPTTYPGFAAQVSGTPTYNKIANVLAYKFMQVSDCTGSVAIFDLPYPILNAGARTFTSTVRSHCPACKVSYNLVQDDEIGTPAATAAIVSKLQSSPSTKYVYVTNGNTALGLVSALGQAHLNGIKIFGQVPTATNIAELRAGENAFWVDESSALTSWVDVDQALRAIQGKQPVADSGDFPLALLTAKNVPPGSDPVLPANYQHEFEKLWHVG
jgi:ABC-type sugar transport system substrate-binding protein